MRNPNWFDWLVYRVYRWRWNPILESNPIMREVIIENIRACELFAPGDRIKVTVTIEEEPAVDG